MQNLGNKIVVVGVSASGKSTFSRRLGEKLRIPVTYMDAIMWKPGWNYIGDGETEKILNEVSEGESWIIEGYISNGSRATIFDKADTIIYLDYSPWVSSWRYIKRYWKHRKQARPELEGSPEKFSFKFLKLVWTKGESISLNKYLDQVINKNKIQRFKTPKESKLFLDSLN